jgi:hypothetical protein
MIASAAIGFGLRGHTAFCTDDTAENGLGEGFVSGVLEGGHGLSLMLQCGFSFFIAGSRLARMFSLFSAGGAAAWPLAARAQKSDRVRAKGIPLAEHIQRSSPSRKK